MCSLTSGAPDGVERRLDRNAAHQVTVHAVSVRVAGKRI